jgi:hypothetical protein
MTETTDTPKYEVATFVEPSQIVSDTQYDQNDLDPHFQRQAGLTYFYATLAAKAERQHADFKLRLEMAEAKVATNVRESAQAAGEKLTADMVKERVRLHPHVYAMERALNEAREVELSLKGAYQAIRDRKDMLVAAGLRDRDERNAHARIMADAGTVASTRAGRGRVKEQPLAS